MSSVSPLTAIFSNIHLQLSRYVYCPLYIAGNIGHIFNIIAFSQAKLRTSSVCSWYFLVLSIADLIAINTGFLTRILAYMGLPDPSRTVGWYCTGRVYISTLSLTLSRHFLCSIVIDRFLVTSTNAKFRRMSSFKIAKWYIPISVLCWMTFYTHVWVGYSGIGNGTSCKRRDGAYTLFVTVTGLSIEAVVPILVMTICSLLTLNNLHGLNQRRNRIMPHNDGTQMTVVRTTNTNKTADNSRQTLTSEKQIQREKKQVGKQLTMIAFIQVLIYIMFNTPSASYALYSVITSSIIRSSDRTAIESFISAIGVMLTFVYATLNFYIYTLVSSNYRREVRAALRRFVMIIQRRF